MTPAPADFLPLAREAASAAGWVLLAERPLVIAEGASATKSSDTDPVTVSELPGPGGRSGILAANPELAGPLSECLLSRARLARS